MIDQGNIIRCRSTNLEFLESLHRSGVLLTEDMPHVDRGRRFQLGLLIKSFSLPVAQQGVQRRKGKARDLAAAAGFCIVAPASLIVFGAFTSPSFLPWITSFFLCLLLWCCRFLGWHKVGVRVEV